MLCSLYLRGLLAKLKIAAGKAHDIQVAGSMQWQTLLKCKWSQLHNR